MISKYRGKRIDNEEEVKGYYWCNEESGKHYIRRMNFQPAETDYTDYEVHPKSVGQWTGEKDMKGVEVWEGDQYYEGKNNDGRKMWTVKWAVAGFIGDYANASGQRYINFADIEIIGNITDSSDLLERSDDTRKDPQGNQDKTSEEKPKQEKEGQEE